MWHHFIITERRGLEIPVLRTDTDGSAGPLGRLWEANRGALDLGRICKGQPRTRTSIFQYGNTGHGCQAPRLVNEMPQELIMWLK